MTRRVVLLMLGVLAVALEVVGVSWKSVIPPESYWSREQAQDYVDAFNAVHRAEDTVEHGPHDPGAAEFLAARHHYDKLKNELDMARTARDRTGIYLAIAGLALFLSIVFLWHFYAPPTDENAG